MNRRMESPLTHTLRVAVYWVTIASLVMTVAYPNYFLDVGMFVERVRPIVAGPRKFKFLDGWSDWRRG